MRDIKILSSQIYQDEQFKDVSFVCFEEFSQIIYVITKQFRLLGFNITTQSINLNLEIDLTSELSDSEVLSFVYILELQSLVIVQKDGKISKVNPQTKEIDILGQFEDGVLGAEWSPSQENLVLLCVDKKLVNFDTNLEPIGEIIIEDLANEPCSFTWNQDAKFFSLNYACLPQGRKCVTFSAQLEVFNSPSKADQDGGLVQNMFEKPNMHLSNGNAWQPGVGYIAGFDIGLPEKYNKRVIFWEKNGLRHLEFMLPQEAKEYSCKSLKWSPDGTILSICIESQNENIICLYIRSNYKWYLKKAIRVLSPYKSFIVNYIWCTQTTIPTIIIVSDSQVEFIRYNYTHNTNNVLVPVTNYNELLLTDFTKAIIPPPMCTRSLKFTSDILFGSAVDEIYIGDHLIVLTASGYVHGYSNQNCGSDKLFELDISDIILATRVSKVSYVSALKTSVAKYIYGSIILVVHDWEISRDMVIEVVLEKQQNEKVSVAQAWRRDFSNENFQVNAVSLSPAFSDNIQGKIQPLEAYVTFYSSGEVSQKYILFGSQQDPFLDLEKCPLQVIRAEEFLFNQITYKVILTIGHKLYLQNNLIANECTSFGIFKHFLIFTQNTPDIFHQLYVVDLKKEIPSADSLQQKMKEKAHLNARHTERGSKIVSIPSNEKIIIQVQRGNLECIAHRILNLYQAQELHIDHQYGKCFDVLRRYKLDMNLLFDFNPQDFQKNISLVVEQITDQQKLQVFIQSLENCVSKELQYVVQTEDLRLIEKQVAEKLNKINFVCQLLMDELCKKNENHYILTIITAHSKKSPPELDLALKRVMQLRQGDKEVQEDVPPHLNPETHQTYKKKHKGIKWDHALEFTCWLADANKIYEVALGTYDFEMVKLVAHYTQKDPKEYLPYLESLQSIEDPINMRSKVQLDLKNYEAAINELSKGNQKQKEKALELIHSHKKFWVGIECFKNEPSMIRQVKKILGEYLVNENQLNQASLAFEAAGLLKEAIQTSMNANDTKRFLQLLKYTHDYNQDEKTDLLQKYLQICKESSRFEECAKICLKLQQVNDGLYYYCKSENWKQAQKCLLLVQDQQQAIDRYVIPALQLSLSIKTNQMIQNENNFKQKLDRLKVVQQNKREIGDFNVKGLNEPEFDAMSDLSQKSGLTKTSYTMSVTTGVRKKKEKKKSYLSRKIKEGSPVEEQYLVEYLKDIQKQAGEQIPSQKSLINYLFVYNLIDEARKFNKTIQVFLKKINIKIQSLAQINFEEKNTDLQALYTNIPDFADVNLPSLYTNALSDLIK